MKKLLLLLVSIIISIVITFVVFEFNSWYHFGDIPTKVVTDRLIIFFIIILIFVYLLIMFICNKIIFKN